MADPTLDELIAWAQGDEGCITPLLPPYGALAAALRELRQLRAAVEKVKSAEQTLRDIANSDAMYHAGFGFALHKIADRVRALTPEGTT